MTWNKIGKRHVNAVVPFLYLEVAYSSQYATTTPVKR